MTAGTSAILIVVGGGAVGIAAVVKDESHAVNALGDKSSTDRDRIGSAETAGPEAPSVDPEPKVNGLGDADVVTGAGGNTSDKSGRTTTHTPRSDAIGGIGSAPTTAKPPAAGHPGAGYPATQGPGNGVAGNGVSGSGVPGNGGPGAGGPGNGGPGNGGHGSGGPGNGGHGSGGPGNGGHGNGGPGNGDPGIGDSGDGATGAGGPGDGGPAGTPPAGGGAIDVPVVVRPAPAPAKPAAHVIAARTVTQTREIPFRTREVRDPDLPRGTREVRSEGVPGVRTLRYRITLIDGREAGRTLIDSTVTRRPQTRVIAVGTHRHSDRHDCGSGSWRCRTSHQSVPCPDPDDSGDNSLDDHGLTFGISDLLLDDDPARPDVDDLSDLSDPDDVDDQDDQNDGDDQDDPELCPERFRDGD